MRAADRFEPVRVRDVRAVAVSRFGDPDGRPCLFFHGRGPSLLEAAIFGTGAACLVLAAWGVISRSGSPLAPNFHARPTRVLSWVASA